MKRVWLKSEPNPRKQSLRRCIAAGTRDLAVTIRTELRPTVSLPSLGVTTYRVALIVA
jgi:hypothetical protein